MNDAIGCSYKAHYFSKPIRPTKVYNPKCISMLSGSKYGVNSWETLQNICYKIFIIEYLLSIIKIRFYFSQQPGEIFQKRHGTVYLGIISTYNNSKMNSRVSKKFSLKFPMYHWIQEIRKPPYTIFQSTKHSTNIVDQNWLGFSWWWEIPVVRYRRWMW